MIAPNLPGFDFIGVTERRDYIHAFDDLAKTMLALTDALNLALMCYFLATGD